MNTSEQKAVLTIAMMAAFADGENSEVERNALRGMAESFGPDAHINLWDIYQDVIDRRRPLALLRYLRRKKRPGLNVTYCRVSRDTVTLLPVTHQTARLGTMRSLVCPNCRNCRKGFVKTASSASDFRVSCKLSKQMNVLPLSSRTQQEIVDRIDHLEREIALYGQRRGAGLDGDLLSPLTVDGAMTSLVGTAARTRVES